MGNIIYLILSWGAALLFVLIGIYARQRKKPMWFWSGIEVPESKVRDVKAYNRANAKMWCVFSIPFWVSGVVEFFFAAFLGCNAGTGRYAGAGSHSLVLPQN